MEPTGHSVNDPSQPPAQTLHVSERAAATQGNRATAP